MIQMDEKEKWSFDNRAASWDKNPGRVKLATEIADAILGEGVLTPNMDILEFGCGTGLLTLRLQPLARRITGVDSSRGMLEILRSKIESNHLANIEARYLDLDRGDVLEGSYDLVVSSMTLHHVREIQSLVSEFYKITAPGGHLCIADLDPEEGEFHGENDTVFHDGFDRQKMQEFFLTAGFRDIRQRTAAEVTKPVSNGTMRTFSVFLTSGTKPSPAGGAISKTR
jgi:ubiquinone/menaquinone biosynthesis C-methylase UbiE